MSSAILETLATIQAILTAETSLVRISTPILLILGNIGEVLSIIIFVQRIFRNNPCAIYFLAASCTRLFFINWTILLNGLSLGYNIDPAQTSLIFCKIKFYLAYITAILPQSFVVLACFDRLMLSSPDANLRLWSRPRFAYRSIAFVSIFWTIFSIHTLYGFVIYHEPGFSYCYMQTGSYTLFITFYLIIINYFSPPILMAIFGLRTVVNVRRAQRQVHLGTGIRNMQRKDRLLLRMLLFQVLINVIFTIPAGACTIYAVISAHWQKNLIWQTWDLFMLALEAMTFYIPYCIGFYIYTLTASIFRQELKRIAVQSYRRFFPQRQTRVRTVAR